jgi:molybdopterin/thiamine biosynthesis adenylyltransferase
MQYEVHLLRAARSGRSDMIVRIPHLDGFQSTKVTVVGAGNLGAFSAVELARSGIKNLCIVDPDFVEAGTIVRWPLGVPSIGEQKVIALKRYLSRHYPYTSVTAIIHRLGGLEKAVIMQDNGPLDIGVSEMLDKYFADSSLILDATTEGGVHHFLSDYCMEKSIPYICVSATKGLWGGVVFKFDPNQDDACWICYLHHIKDGNIQNPPVDHKGETPQPVGCGMPTFIGASFESGIIVNSAVRMAASVLCPSYPNADWNLEVISLRDSNGNMIAPKWKVQELQVHEECASHRMDQ